jgi:alpha-amylase
MIEYDFKATEKNLLDTMTRREEGYHQKLYHATLAGESSDSTASIHDLVITKEAGLEKYLVYDNYERKSFVDHFIGLEVNVHDFAMSNYTELGDFYNGIYEVHDKQEKEDRIIFTFSKEGKIKTGDSSFPLKIVKTITVYKNKENIEASYQLINLSGQKQNVRFAVEFNFGLQAGHAHDRYYYNSDGRLADAFLDSTGQLEKSKFIGLKDEWMKIDIQLSGDGYNNIYYLPVETISLSEAGFEKVYQSSTVLLVWDIELEEKAEISLAQKVSSF